MALRAVVEQSIAIWPMSTVGCANVTLPQRPLVASPLRALVDNQQELEPLGVHILDQPRSPACFLVVPVFGAPRRLHAFIT